MNLHGIEAVANPGATTSQVDRQPKSPDHTHPTKRAPLFSRFAPLHFDWTSQAELTTRFVLRQMIPRRCARRHSVSTNPVPLRQALARSQTLLCLFDRPRHDRLFRGVCAQVVVTLLRPLHTRAVASAWRRDALRCMRTPRLRRAPEGDGLLRREGHIRTLGTPAVATCVSPRADSTSLARWARPK
jgi:hypothetical protein